MRSRISFTQLHNADLVWDHLGAMKNGLAYLAVSILCVVCCLRSLGVRDPLFVASSICLASTVWVVATRLASSRRRIQGARGLLGTSRIHWCPHKAWDHTEFQNVLQPSLDRRQVTNGGPLQQVLMKTLQQLTGSTRMVVPAASGTAALHALVAGWSLKLGGPLRWATQAFTFPSAMQGPLADSIVVDHDPLLGGPSIKELERVLDQVDGIIVTNIFGLQVRIAEYEAWCTEHGLLLIFDNAATAIGLYGDHCIHDAGDGAFISLHETKPLGRGEGLHCAAITRVPRHTQDHTS